MIDGQPADKPQDGAGAPAGADGGTPPAKPADSAGSAPAASAPAEDVASLPDWAQKLIGKTRTEAATNRTKANMASEALSATRDAIAKALGLKEDDDPVKAAQTAAEERDLARAERKQLRVENAVLRSAHQHGADPESLTDSRSFMKLLEAIDPDADDFAAQVGAAIKAAVEANPNLKAQGSTAPPRSGGPVGGGTPAKGQLSRDDLKGMTPAQINKAREDGQLNQLLGIT